MKFSAIVCLFFLALTSGCSRKIISTSQSEKHDSSFVKEVEITRDTFLTTIPDSSTIRIPLRIVDSKIVDQPKTTKKNKNASASLEVIGGNAIAKCDCDSITLQCKTYQQSTYYYKSENEKIKSEKQIPISYTPTWIRILAWIGGMVLIVSVALIGYHYSASRIIVTHIKK